MSEQQQTHNSNVGDIVEVEHIGRVEITDVCVTGSTVWLSVTFDDE